jgi:predicted aldo/keto reductase-like oxidoreductase
MAKYLIDTTETYRVDSEAEVEQLIAEAKKDSTCILAKYSSVHKEKKVKGVVEDEWYKVTLVKKFNDEKDPDDIIAVRYEAESAF